MSNTPQINSPLWRVLTNPIKYLLDPYFIGLCFILLYSVFLNFLLIFLYSQPVVLRTFHVELWPFHVDLWFLSVIIYSMIVLLYPLPVVLCSLLGSLCYFPTILYSIPTVLCSILVFLCSSSSCFFYSLLVARSLYPAYSHIRPFSFISSQSHCAHCSTCYLLVILHCMWLLVCTLTLTH